MSFSSQWGIKDTAINVSWELLPASSVSRPYAENDDSCTMASCFSFQNSKFLVLLVARICLKVQGVYPVTTQKPKEWLTTHEDFWLLINQIELCTPAAKSELQIRTSPVHISPLPWAQNEALGKPLPLCLSSSFISTVRLIVTYLNRVFVRTKSIQYNTSNVLSYSAKHYRKAKYCMQSLEVRLSVALPRLME